MGRYSDDPAWADIIPLPTDEGGPNPLAAIAYDDEYAEAMSYLRAVMAANEFSPRILDLTEDLIDMNPAHYTVWLYRAQCLFALKSDLHAELAWLNATALEHQKNYQIWHHRMLVVDVLDSCEGEREFVSRMFELDAKNYHVWSYRQWLVRRFGLWEQGELEFTRDLIEKDVRNNSAWNHRWYVVNGREEREEGEAGGVVGDAAVREREMEFAMQAIEKAPQNQSSWGYLRGIVRKAGLPLQGCKAFVQRFASLEQPDEVRSSYALDFMAEILAEEKGSEQQAALALDMLAQKYDPVRRNYWEYRKGLLGVDAVAA
ncbi:hypothetical protein BDY17DRAFT_255166 [Neohortaea acidophila]|uniref:Protein farnesyltransferase/geranylgeranyltransferase type-1 subunit alpha n=1 Tax=Neohortaea acidophila TaxID=245834 RepID=A0A6A6PL34_9PEZI|nr:uncharacterized protein BDY17DRAFT_255166 [Neohortaea acidophila]KAF2480635.1 hypothetical protein BDY17DRAFT_255166 [Neohortaea acidophila]